MSPSPAEVPYGTLDLMVLKTLQAMGPLHGYGIARRIEQISRDVFRVNPGSLITALQRLEREGLIDAKWKQTENSRRAKFYSLTPGGRRQLDHETADWKRRAGAVARLLGTEA
jgi:PadR family transcriptional regulator, regulatory protein PadR